MKKCYIMQYYIMHIHSTLHTLVAVWSYILFCCCSVKTPQFYFHVTTKVEHNVTNHYTDVQLHVTQMRCIVYKQKCTMFVSKRCWCVTEKDWECLQLTALTALSSYKTCLTQFRRYSLAIKLSYLDLLIFQARSQPSDNGVGVIFLRFWRFSGF